MEETRPRPRQLPRIIPVMDIRGGVVVRAVAGRRSEYRPVVSRLTDSTDPLVVAEALRAAAGTDELYVADLDAIFGNGSNLHSIRALVNKQFRVWVDAGLQIAGDALPLIEAGVAVVIAGLETLDCFDELALLRMVVGEPVTVSLDMRNGVVLGDDSAPPPMELIDSLAESFDIDRLIVLDIARVGTGFGTGTEELCARAKVNHPRLELIAGGGVRGPEDLPALADAGVDAVLVASALHDGKFGLPGATQ